MIKKIVLPFLPIAIYFLFTFVIYKEELIALDYDVARKSQSIDYIFFDFIATLIYLWWLLKNKYYMALLYGCFWGGFLYNADAIGFFNNGIGKRENGEIIYQREYIFTVKSSSSSSTSSTTTLHRYSNDEDILSQFYFYKSLCDYYIDITAIRFLSIIYVFFDEYINYRRSTTTTTARKRSSPSILIISLLNLTVGYWALEFGAFLFPFISTHFHDFSGVNLFAIRHMAAESESESTAEVSFKRLAFSYFILAIYGLLKGDEFISIFVFICTIIVNAAAVSPLYIFGIRPTSIDSLNFKYELMYTFSILTGFAFIFHYEVVVRIREFIFAKNDVQADQDHHRIN